MKARRFGGKIVDRVNEPHEWLVYVTDPDGVWLEFIGNVAHRPAKWAPKTSASG